LTLNGGLIELHERSRTRKRALARLKELVLASAQGNTAVDLGVVHVQCPDDAQMLAEELGAELQPKHLLVDLMGPGIGVHVGPGMIGAGVYCDEWAER
jgi:fatty acid-binding protein DegV